MHRVLVLPLAALALTLLTATASADCSASATWLWPPQDTQLPPRPLLVVDTYGTDQPEIKALRAGGRAALVAEGHRVALEIEAVNVGRRARSQAVLRAEEALKPGLTYAFEARDAKGDRILGVERPDGRGPAQWTAGDGAPARLESTGAAAVAGQSYMLFGCGPGSTMKVDLPARSGAPMVVEVKLTEKGKAPLTYLLAHDGAQVAIGHGMCSGAFDVTGPERRFAAALTVRDSAGRRTKTRTVRFGGVDPNSPE